MNKIKKMIVLDFISLKPYFTWKNLLILLGISAYFYFIEQSPLAIFSITLIFTMIYSSYPFLLGDESGIDSLYRMFSINPQKVVIGRYLVSLILFVAMSLIAFVLYILSSLALHAIDLEPLAGTFFLYSAIYLVMICFQYPLYFKYGYTKAKILSMLPFLFVGAIGMAGYYFREQIAAILPRIAQHRGVILFCSFVLVLLIVTASMRTSIRVYRKRDF